MPTTTTTASQNPRCGGFFSLRGCSGEPRVRRSLPGHGQPGCGRIDRVATWVGNGVAAAFFASLERCSCINIDTDDDQDEPKDVPLIYDDGNARREAGGLGRGQRRRRGKGKKSGGGCFNDFMYDDK
ncbi:hypothetical protein COCNU_scaffold001487G000010 [Cocos nucifera]|nr:hypothetical protein [Cocos nucifera]